MSEPVIRIALLGFSGFERNALASSFKLLTDRHPDAPVYAHVLDLDAADFIIADADDRAAVSLLRHLGRLGDAVFVGAAAPGEAAAWMLHPINPPQLLRELDSLLMRRRDAQQTHEDLRSDLRSAPMPLMPWPPLGPEATAAGLEPEGLSALGTGPHAERRLGAAGRRVDDRAAPAANDRRPSATGANERRPSAPGAGGLPAPEGVSRLRDHEGNGSLAKAAAARAMPAESRHAASVAATRLSMRSSDPETAQRVLVVDDSEVAAHFLRRELGRYRLQADLAATGEEALERLAQRAYRMVFLDVDLGPRSSMDGFTLCHRIRHLPLRRGEMPPPVVMVSAFHDSVNRVRGTLAGAEAYLGKPLSFPELERLMRRHGLVRQVLADKPLPAAGDVLPSLPAA